MRVTRRAHIYVPGSEDVLARLAAYDQELASRTGWQQKRIEDDRLIVPDPVAGNLVYFVAFNLEVVIDVGAILPTRQNCISPGRIGIVGLTSPFTVRLVGLPGSGGLGTLPSTIWISRSDNVACDNIFQLRPRIQNAIHAQKPGHPASDLKFGRSVPMRMVVKQPLRMVLRKIYRVLVFFVRADTDENVILRFFRRCIGSMIMEVCIALFSVAEFHAKLIAWTHTQRRRREETIVKVSCHLLPADLDRVRRNCQLNR